MSQVEAHIAALVRAVGPHLLGVLQAIDNHISLPFYKARGSYRYALAGEKIKDLADLRCEHHENGNMVRELLSHPHNPWKNLVQKVSVRGGVHDVVTDDELCDMAHAHVCSIVVRGTRVFDIGLMQKHAVCVKHRTIRCSVHAIPIHKS
eukprot:CAMPEP_0179472112 /NCGR_PEP_ID=MMETSP0799-20121207/52203_1 /TAXON_ID=46947 /ORGANISM="Geminigera cryophila, Strain CCMP2564" /LENGTH=148 /DNA_ID=CAMNT_0021280119 /DNA_START=224 /DNA_END=667 /DNA_ORIENTATION=+